MHFLFSLDVVWARISCVLAEIFGQKNIIRRINIKPLSHWDATSSQWVCESIHQTVAKGSHGIPKSLHASRTVCQSFKHVILFCVTKIIAKPSPSHCILCKPVANPSQTFLNTLQGSFRDLHNATNMQHK